MTMTYKKTYKTNSQGNRKHKKVAPQATSPKILLPHLSINGTKFVDNYQFTCGNSVPIYEVLTVHAFNQLVGYAKFNNQSYGNIYYRGECKLHNSLKPSLFRNVKNPNPSAHRLNALIKKFVDDNRMRGELKLIENDYESAEIKVEGMLQHYGVPTRFVDVVDNHWGALWMGLNKADKPKQVKQYYHYVERQVPLIEIAKGTVSYEDELFQYVLLLAIPFAKQRTFTGIQISNDYIEVDLRQALPSIF